MDFLKDYGNTEGPLGFPMPDKQARALEQILKALPRGEEYSYRKLTTVKAPTEIMPGERSDVSWISTESPDRLKEVVLSRGMNNSQFQANPLVTLQHAYFLPPVGRSLWQKKVKDGAMTGIKAKTIYPPCPEGWSDPWPADKAFALIQSGLMQGKSIGCLPTRVHVPDLKEYRKYNWPDSSVNLVIDEWILLEYACCLLPVNQESLVEQVAKGELDPLPDDFLEAMGLSPDIFKGPQPPKGQDVPAQAGLPSFTSCISLSEIERAVSCALESVSVEALVEQVLEKKRGRV
jgi:hypothetical protein